jgi:hypothetical protein
MSTPQFSPGAAPSNLTTKCTGLASFAGASTKCRSRLWNRNTIFPGTAWSTALSALTFHDPLNPQWFNEGFAGALNTWIESLCTLSGEAKFWAWQYPIYVSGDPPSVQSGAASIPTPDTLVVSEARPVAPFSFTNSWMTRSMSEAGRQLFDASRTRKTSTNDADRLRKYLGRFGIEWNQIAES